MKNKIIHTIGAVLCFVAVGILIYIFVYQFKHPTMTQMQAFIKFWKLELLMAVMGIAGEIMVRKGESFQDPLDKDPEEH